MKHSKHAPVRIGIKIQEIMTREVVTVGPDATVAEAARLMCDRDVGLLPVCDGEEVVGVLTDRDLVVRALAHGLNPKKTRVRQIFTPEAHYCFPDEDVREAVATLEGRQVRRVLVLSRQKKLVGVLSIGDVAVDTGNQGLAGEMLRKVSEPEKAAS